MFFNGQEKEVFCLGSSFSVPLVVLKLFSQQQRVFLPLKKEKFNKKYLLPKNVGFLVCCFNMLYRTASNKWLEKAVLKNYSNKTGYRNI